MAGTGIVKMKERQAMFNQIWLACTKEKGAMPQIVTLSKARVHQNLSNERKATGVRSEIVSAVVHRIWTISGYHSCSIRDGKIKY